MFEGKKESDKDKIIQYHKIHQMFRVSEVQNYKNEVKPKRISVEIKHNKSNENLKSQHNRSATSYSFRFMK